MSRIAFRAVVFALMTLFAAGAMAQPACKPGDAKSISAAHAKVKSAEARLAVASPAQKAAAQKTLDAAKAELAKLECK